MRLTIGRVVTALGLAAAPPRSTWSVVPRPIPVETATVTKGRFVATVDEDGKTRVRERYVVAAPLAGRLTRIRLKVGDRVGVDDVVATIAPSPAPFLDPRSRREAEERLGAAEATIERTKAASSERGRKPTRQKRSRRARARWSSAERRQLRRLSARNWLCGWPIANLRAADFLNHAAEHELNQARALLAATQDGDAKAASEDLERHRTGARSWF